MEILAHSESFIHIPPLHISLLPIFQSYSFQIPDQTAKPLATACGQFVYNYTSAHFSLPSEQPGALLKVLPNKRISPHHCSSELSHKGAVVLQLSTLGWCLCIVQSYLQIRPKSSLLLLLVRK